MYYQETQLIKRVSRPVMPAAKKVSFEFTHIQGLAGLFHSSKNQYHVLRSTRGNIQGEVPGYSSQGSNGTSCKRLL